MDKEKVIVIDFGGQYNQLVARRVRECNVYCEIYSYRTDIETIKAMNPKGIILTGGPNSCYEADSPTYSKELFELGIPVLGLCYGAQLMMHVLGGKVEKAPVREYGKTEVMVDKNSPLFQNVEEKTICWMSHFDYISKTAPGFEIVAHTADCPVAAAENREKNLYAIQFHPEVLHTQYGKEPFRLSEIRTAPFYACKLSGMALATLDGIKINTKFQALDENNAPIEGLYVIGNDSGNYYNGTYPNLAAGLNAGRCVTFGMLCGRQVANL